MKDLGQTIVDEVAFFTEDVHTVNQVWATVVHHYSTLEEFS
jgi:hypothetical protein